MLADKFAEVFRKEHREIRDTLFAVTAAFEAGDKVRIGACIEKAAELTGPHFRYEEEALYPSLVEIFGKDYVEKLLSDHDRAIGTAKALVGLSAKDMPSAEDAERAARLVRSILPHVSDCEGLSIMVERLPDAEVRKILERRDKCRAEGLDLIQWATGIRKRPFASVDPEAVA